MGSGHNFIYFFREPPDMLTCFFDLIIERQYSRIRSRASGPNILLNILLMGSPYELFFSFYDAH